MAYQTSAGLDDSFAVIRHSIESGEKLSLNKLSELENLYEDDNKGQGDDEDMNMSDDIQSLTPEQLLEDERKKERLSSETASGTEDRGPKIGMDFLNASKAMNAELQKRSNSRGRNKSEGDGSETRRMLRRATSGDLVYGNIGSSSHSRNSPEFERQPLRRTKSTSGEELFGSRHKPGLRGRSSASVEQLRRSSSHSASGDQFQRSTHSSRGMRRSTHSRRSGSQSSEQLAADIAKAAAEAAIEFDSDDSDVEDRDATTRRKEESQVISSIESESKQEGSSQRQKRTGTPFSATLRRPSTTTREENTQEPERRRSRGRSQRRASSSQGSKRSTSASLHGDSSTRGRRNRDISTDSRRISSSLHGRHRDRSESRQRSSSLRSSRREDPRSRSLSRSRSGTSSSSISGHSQRGGVRRASSASADLFELAKLAHKAQRDAKRDGPSELKNTRSGDRDLRALVKHAKEDRKGRKSKKKSGRKTSDRSGKDGSKESKPSKEKEQSKPKAEGASLDSLKLNRGVLDEIKQRSADSDGDQKSKNKAGVILRNAVAGRSRWGGVRSGMEFINRVKKASKESRSSEKVTDTNPPEKGKSNSSKWGGVKLINKTKGLLKDKKNKNDDEDMQRFAEVVFSSDLMKMKAEALVAAGAKEEEQNVQKPLGGVDGENEAKNAKHSLDNVDHSISAEARSRIFGDVLTSTTTISEVERSHAKAPESKISVEAERKGKGADVPSGGERGPFEDPKTHGPATSFEVEAQVQSSKVLPNASENKVAENAARVKDVPTQTPEKLVTSETSPKVVTPDSNPPETSNLPPKNDRSSTDGDDDDTCSSTSDSSGNQLDMSIFLSPLKCAQLQIQPDQQEKKELTIQIHGLSKTDDEDNEDDDAGADGILFLDNQGVEHEAYDAWRKQGAVIPLFGIDSKQPAENDGTDLGKAQAKNAGFEFEIKPSAQSVKEINQDSSAKNMLATELKQSKARLLKAREELLALEASFTREEANFRSVDSRFRESTKRLAANKVVLNRLGS